MRHQLSALGAAAPAEGSSRRDLVYAYWECLKGLGKEHEEETRRWLAVPKEMDQDAQAKLWISLMVNRPLADGPLQPLLRSGELLCLLVNVIKPGIVPKIARDESTAAMTEQRRNAKMRENIGQYVDGCAELGVSTGELFITA